MNRATKLILIAALAAAVATTSGCFRRVRIEDVTKSRTITERIAAGEASATATHIAFGAGELKVSGSDIASDAVEGDFTFAPNTLRPELTSEVTSSGALYARIDQPDVLNVPPASIGGPVNMTQRWDVKLSNKLATDLWLNMGAGDANIDLTNVDLTALHIGLGAGATKLDLSGPRTRALSATIQAGVGEIVVRLPKGLPVRVTGSQDGLGDYKYDDGFHRSGGDIVNDAWETAQHGTTDYKGQIELNIQQGIGEVRLELVD